MILYLVSDTVIEKPKIKFYRSYTDLDKGFYLASAYKDALKFCEKFKKQGKDSFISSFEFAEDKLNTLNVIKFDDYSESWLDFILSCRSGQDTSNYDLVIGGVANDRVFNTIELFFDGLIGKDEAIKRLRFEKPNLQFCFRTPLALSCLTYIKVTRL
mgnify:CR=1 FL=1